ncbi:MAG: TAXI family TRAP transporter solute-binding subunit [Rhodospirillales bacterium]
MRKSIIAVAALVAMVFAAGQAQAQQFINILTGGTGGVYYPIGVALANVYAKGIPGSQPTAQATKGSVENLQKISKGEGELALTLGDSLSFAWNGNADVGFPTPLKNLRAVANTYANYIQILASKDSGIKTLADLKGKRLSVGAPKSGTELNTRAVLAAAGITYQDLAKVEYLDFNQSVELIKNRQLDATLQSVGLGNSALRDLANSVEIIVVPIPADIANKIPDKAYVQVVVPANTYKGQTADVPTVAVANILVTNEKLSTDLVYQMTKLLFENLDTLSAAHAAAKDIKLATALNGISIPLHPGAEKYYREKGLIK